VAERELGLLASVVVFVVVVFFVVVVVFFVVVVVDVIIAVWRYRVDAGDTRGRGRNAHRRGWEAVECRAKAGRMRHVTPADGVGHPPNGRLVGAPVVFLLR